jgi:charged multivesicular body protein 5
MEQASITTENLRNTMATVDAMKTANKELKKQYGKLDVDKIEVRLSSCSFLLDSIDPLSSLFSLPSFLPLSSFAHFAANALRHGRLD